MNQSHFWMYFTTQNSCMCILASSGLEAQLTQPVGDRECYHLMLLYASHISVGFAVGCSEELAEASSYSPSEI